MTTRGLRAAATMLLAFAAGTGTLADARPFEEGPRPAGGASGRVATRVQREAYLMGTRVTLATRAVDRARGLQILERMLQGLEAVEAELSTWREDSRLSVVNRQPAGIPRSAPGELCELLGELAAWQRATDRAFDPAIGSLVAAWGLREGGRLPSAVELARARESAGLDHLAVELAPCRVTRRRDVTLDAGAFGKGAALDRVAEAELTRRTPAWMIDLGGQVAVGGRGGEPWPVELAHPRRRGEAAFHLRLRSGSLATSGGSVRNVEVEGRSIGHIVDPRTGEPVSRIETVTVWHPRALVADVLSTALYVMGVDEGLAWAEAQGLAACFFVPGRAGSAVTMRATPAFRERFLSTRPADPGSAPPARREAARSTPPAPRRPPPADR
jgi:thiamine biosynthesis lipoprotein